MKWLVKVIFKAVKILLSVVLTPIDTLISTIAPSTTEISAGVNSFFTFLTDGVLLVKSWLPFTSAFWIILVSVLVFKYTLPLFTHTIKVIIAWYNALKP